MGIDPSKCELRLWWRDQEGRNARQRWWLSTATDPLDPTAFIEDLLVSAVYMTTIDIWKTETAYTRFGGFFLAVQEYSTAHDKAIFLFRDAAGGEVRFSIPGPSKDLFLPDGITIDTLQFPVQNFISNVLAKALSQGGEPIVEYVRGWRDGSKVKRKRPGMPGR